MNPSSLAPPCDTAFPVAEGRSLPDLSLRSLYYGRVPGKAALSDRSDMVSSSLPKDRSTAVSKTKGHNKVPERLGLQTGRSGNTSQCTGPRAALVSVCPASWGGSGTGALGACGRTHQVPMARVHWPDAGPEEALVGARRDRPSWHQGTTAVSACVCHVTPRSSPPQMTPALKKEACRRVWGGRALRRGALWWHCGLCRAWGRSDVLAAGPVAPMHPRRTAGPPPHVPSPCRSGGQVAAPPARTALCCPIRPLRVS